MSAGLDNFAPRVGGVYPPQRQDGVPLRLRPHLQRPGLGACGPRRQRLPGDDRRDVPSTPSSSPAYGTLQQGIPFMRGSGPELGPRAARSLRRRVHAGDRQHRSRLRPHLERRLRAPAAVRTPRSTSPTSARRASAATPALDINAPQTLGGGDASRPYVEVRPHRSRSTRGAHACRPSTSRCRSRSTSRSPMASCSRAPTR